VGVDLLLHVGDGSSLGLSIVENRYRDVLD
jgi:hypothetical protein